MLKVIKMMKDNKFWLILNLKIFLDKKINKIQLLKKILLLKKNLMKKILLLIMVIIKLLMMFRKILLMLLKVEIINLLNKWLMFLKTRIFWKKLNNGKRMVILNYKMMRVILLELNMLILYQKIHLVMINSNKKKNDL